MKSHRYSSLGKITVIILGLVFLSLREYAYGAANLTYINKNSRQYKIKKVAILTEVKQCSLEFNEEDLFRYPNLNQAHTYGLYSDLGNYSGISPSRYILINNYRLYNHNAFEDSVSQITNRLLKEKLEQIGYQIIEVEPDSNITLESLLTSMNSKGVQGVFILRLSAIKKYVPIWNYRSSISAGGRVTIYRNSADIEKTIHSGLALIPSLHLFDTKTCNLLYSEYGHCLDDINLPRSIQRIGVLFSESEDNLIEDAAENMMDLLFTTRSTVPWADIVGGTPPDSLVIKSYIKDIVWCEPSKATTSQHMEFIRIGPAFYSGKNIGNINGIYISLMDFDFRHFGFTVGDFIIGSKKEQGLKDEFSSLRCFNFKYLFKPIYHIKPLRQINTSIGASYVFNMEKHQFMDDYFGKTTYEYELDGLEVNIGFRLESWPYPDFEYRICPGGARCISLSLTPIGFSKKNYWTVSKSSY